jgi:ATP/maltotriose-dependent transcriptional regulator MalT
VVSSANKSPGHEPKHEYPHNAPSEFLTTTLNNEIGAISEPFILMLDDYHMMNQGELMGVLHRLYGLGFPLLSVECVEIGD